MIRQMMMFLGLVMLTAQAMADVKIGIVNTDRVMRESAPAVRAQKKLDKEFEKRKQELQAQAKQLQGMQEDLERNAVTLNDNERRTREKEFGELNREFQRKQREFFEDLNLRQNEERNGLIERLSKAIAQVAESEKFDLILQEALYAHPRIDVTDKVIKALGEAPAK